MPISDGSVNRNPGQLLRFLGLSGPDAPNRVNDLIQGTVDLLPWWLYASAQSIQNQIAIGAGVLGFLTGNAITCPANQRWIISAHSCRRAALGAGNSIKVACAWQPGGGATQTHILGQFSSFVATEAPAVDGFMGSGPAAYYFLNPGDQAGIYVVQNIGAAPDPITVDLRVVAYGL